jgi:hypothetical protein
MPATGIDHALALEFIAEFISELLMHGHHIFFQWP